MKEIENLSYVAIQIKSHEIEPDFIDLLLVRLGLAETREI